MERARQERLQHSREIPNPSTRVMEVVLKHSATWVGSGITFSKKGKKERRNSEVQRQQLHQGVYCNNSTEVFYVYD